MPPIKTGSGLSPIQMYEANKNTITNSAIKPNNSTSPVKNNKNVLMGVAAAAGIAAVVAGGILIHKNISAQKIINEAQNALDKADDIKTEAQNVLNKADSIKAEAENISVKAGSVKEEGKKIFEKGKNVLDEVTDFITKGAKKNYDDVLDESGNVIRKFETHEADGKKVLDKMTEFAADGTEKRATTVAGGAVDTVEDFAEKVRYRYYKDSPANICKGYEKLSDGREKIAEAYGYNGDKLLFYAKNPELLPNDDIAKATEVFGFDENELLSYLKNINSLPDKTGSIGESFYYERGILSKYDKNCELLSGGTVKTEEEFNFANRFKHSSIIYKKNIEISSGGTSKTAESFGFKNGNFLEYTKNHKFSSDRTGKTAEIFEFDENGLSAYLKNHEMLSDKTQKAAERFGFCDNKFSEYLKGVKYDSKGNFVTSKKEFEAVDGKLKKCVSNGNFDD